MKIGFIGLGNVGAKLSGSLLRNGTDLMVRDLNKDTAAPLLAVGALWADSPKQMAKMISEMNARLLRLKFCQRR